MRHCGLALLPGRGGLAGEILSHDFVEAALMGRMGYEVWLVPQLGGSWEQAPSNLLDELQRDRRWCQGNLQNLRLVAEPGWRPAHRAMFAVGALSYAVAPLWLLFIVLGLSSGGTIVSDTPLWLLTLLLLLLPRVLGAAAVVAGGEAAAFGGVPRLALGALLELLLSSLQAPLRMLAHCVYVLGALTGLKLEWKSPPRAAEAPGWADATRRIGSLVLLPLAACFGLMRRAALLALAPMWLPLSLAVPFVVLCGHPRAGRWVATPGPVAHAGGARAAATAAARRRMHRLPRSGAAAPARAPPAQAGAAPRPPPCNDRLAGCGGCDGDGLAAIGTRARAAACLARDSAIGGLVGQRAGAAIQHRGANAAQARGGPARTAGTQDRRRAAPSRDGGRRAGDGRAGGAGLMGRLRQGEARMTIQLYAFDTPNGRKISVALEEMGLPYEVHVVDLGKREQFDPAFLDDQPEQQDPGHRRHRRPGRPARSACSSRARS